MSATAIIERSDVIEDQEPIGGFGRCASGTVCPPGLGSDPKWRVAKIETQVRCVTDAELFKLARALRIKLVELVPAPFRHLF
jgi:hypothetical protein